MIYPYILAILAVLFWSANVVVGNALVGILTPWQIAFFRWGIACLLCLPFAWKRMVIEWSEMKKHLCWLISTAIIGITISNTLAYYASETVKAIDLSLIGVTGPIFLILCSKIAGDIALSKQQILGLLCTLVGLFIVILHGRMENLKAFHFAIGDLWMLGMAFTFGFYSFLMTKRPDHLSQNSILSWLLCLGFLGTIPPFIHETLQHPLVLGDNVTPTVSLIMLYMGIFNSLLAYLFWNLALEKGGPVRIGMLYYIMPIFSAIEAHFFLNEQLYSSQLYGGIIILMGIYLVNRQRSTTA
ncbi:MAG: DMT family transporter [Alphaproteobacteria bacterium]|nr:DMT family transporter [Alphaproteobacteria bacterium]